MNIKRWSKVGLGTFLLALSSLLSRALGIVRDALFANYFGAGSGSELLYDINTYFAAFKVPDLVYTLLVFGALSAAFIPIYTELIHKDEKAALKFSNQILNALLVLLLLGSGVLFLLAPYFLPLLLPGFSVDQLELSVELTRIMLLSPIFFTLSSVFQGIENAHKKFLGIALAPIMYNLGIILATLFYAEHFGVYALAWGAVLGAFLHFLVQVPGAVRAGYRYFWSWNLKAKEVREFITLSLPRILGLSLSQFSILIDTFLATLIGGGALAIYTYSTNLESLAYGVVGISLSIAVFSTLSEHASKKDEAKFITTLRSSVDTLVFWTLPSIVGVFFLSDAIVELILLRGEFQASDAELTSFTLKIFIWAALGQSLIPLFARAFYSLKNTKTPVLVALFSIILALSNSAILILVYDYGVWVLALSACIAATFNAALLIRFLARRLKCHPWDFITNKVLFSSILFTGLMAGLLYAMSSLEFPNLILELGISTASGALLYLGLHSFTKTIPSGHRMKKS